MKRAAIRSLGVCLLGLLLAGGCGKLSGVDDLHLAPGETGGAGAGGSGGKAPASGGANPGSGGQSSGGTIAASGGTFSGGTSGGGTSSGGIANTGGSIPPDGGGTGGDPDGGGGCPPNQIVCAGVCVPDDVKNCGACGHDCTVLPHITGNVSCSSGVCGFTPAACEPGYLNCSGNPDDGCDAAINVATRCGSCTTVCGGGTPVCGPVAGSPGQFACSSGCATGLTLCSGACVDLQKDPAHCGSCTQACPTATGGTATCTAGTTCGITCNSGQHPCSGACVSNTDPKNCGSLCNTNCPAPTAGGGAASCNGNLCALSCPPSTKACGTACVNVTGNDSANCGDCGVTCGTGRACSAGQCLCTGGATACGTACVNLQTSASHCGRCDHSCFAGTCSAGQCQQWTVAEAPTTSTITTFTSDGNFVVWGDRNAKAVYRVSMTGTGKITLGSDPSFDSIQADNYFSMSTGGGKIAWAVGNRMWTATMATANSAVVYPFAFTGGTDELYNVVMSPAGTHAALMLGIPGSGFPDYALYSCILSTGSCGNPGTFTYFPQGAAANANNYYFPDLGDGNVYAHRFGSVNYATLTTGQSSPMMMGIDSANLYWWAASGTQGVYKMPLVGGSPTRIASTAPANHSGMTGIASDGAYVYYGTIGTPQTLYYAPVGGCCTATPFATATSLGSVIVAGGKVIWRDSNVIYAMATR
jgi:hypothetical protein